VGFPHERSELGLVCGNGSFEFGGGPILIVCCVAWTVIFSVWLLPPVPTM
jgi:hypothetical protein